MAMWHRVGGSRSGGAESSRRARRLALLGCVVAMLASGPAASGTTDALLARPPAVPRSAAGSALAGVPDPSWWTSMLASSYDLGPSRSSRVDVVVTLGPRQEGALNTWASTHGFATNLFAGGGVAVIAGRPASLGRAFQVSIHDFRAADGQRFYAARGVASLPPALRPVVTGVGRISSFYQVTSDYVPGGALLPGGLLKAYDATPLRSGGFAGGGETVVAFEVDGFSARDLSAFQRQYLPASQRSTKLTVVGGQAGPSSGESNLDLETLMEIAPQAHLVYFNLLHNLGANETLTAALLRGFKAVASSYPGAIWSLSLGFCEKAFGFADLHALDLVLAEAESHGTTVFASSGDSGGLECTPQNWGPIPTQQDVGVQVPAVLPLVTGVGGTTLSVTSSGAYAGETTWTDPALSQGTGGGVSTLFAQPSWQVGPGLPTPSGSRPRQVPDVSADANPDTGNAIVSGGSNSVGGGTSLSAPIWAGLTALIDGYLRRNGRAPLGFANPALYRLAAGGARYTAFHDVTIGGNDIYTAGAGYDPVTGLGSPDAWNLARDLAASGTGG